MASTAQSDVGQYDQNGDKILFRGMFHHNIFIIGLIMSLAAGALSGYTLIMGSGQGMNFSLFDMAIVALAVYGGFICTRNLVYNRKRAFVITNKRVYGHDDSQPFELMRNQIAKAEIFTKKTTMMGEEHFLKIRTKEGQQIQIAQLKDVKKALELLAP